MVKDTIDSPSDSPVDTPAVDADWEAFKSKRDYAANESAKKPSDRKPEDFKDWNVWLVDGRWHAANVDNVGYVVVGNWDDLCSSLDEYGKVNN